MQAFNRRASMMLSKDEAPPAYLDAKAPQPDAPILTTSRASSFFASLIEPPAKNPSQSFLANTFAPGATCHLLVFPTIKGQEPSQRWKSLSVRLTGTSDIRPFESMPTVHTVARVHEEFPVAKAAGGGVPIAVSITLPMAALCRCNDLIPLPSSKDHAEPGVTLAGNTGVGGGKSGGLMQVQYQIEITVARKGLLKGDESVIIPITVYSPPFESEVASIAHAGSNRTWRTSTLVGPGVAARMPAPYAPLVILSAELEHYITELPKTLNISWRLSLKTPPQDVNDGAALSALFSEKSFSLIFARKLVPVVKGLDVAAPAARVPLQTRRNLVEVLREPQPGQPWSPSGVPINGVRMTGVTVVEKTEVPIIRSCNGGTQYYLIARIESPDLVASEGINGGSPVALNVHKRLFVPKKGMYFPSSPSLKGKTVDGIIPLTSRKREMM